MQLFIHSFLPTRGGEQKSKATWVKVRTVFLNNAKRGNNRSNNNNMSHIPRTAYCHCHSVPCQAELCCVLPLFETGPLYIYWIWCHCDIEYPIGWSGPAILGLEIDPILAKLKTLSTPYSVLSTSCPDPLLDPSYTYIHIHIYMLIDIIPLVSAPSH